MSVSSRTLQSAAAQVKTIGARADQALAAPNASGRVLAVVSDAAYLETSDGEIIWLANEGLPQHSRALLGTFDVDSFRIGMTYRREQKLLRFLPSPQTSEQKSISDSPHLDLAGAQVWEASPIRRILRREIISARVLQLIGFLESHLSSGNAGSVSELPLSDGEKSLAKAIPIIAAMTRSEKVRVELPGDDFLYAALPCVRKMGRACLDRDLTRAAQIGQYMIGLGRGLTPSGDDFLGGFLFMAHYVWAAFPEGSWRQQPIEDLLARARIETHPISYTLLCDHARGEGTEALHDLVAGVLRAEKTERMFLLIRRLVKIGSATGWDLLTGALTGMLLMLETSSPPRDSTRHPARS